MMNINFRMEDSLVKLVAEQAAKEGTTMSQIIRQAVVMYITRGKK